MCWSECTSRHLQTKLPAIILVADASTHRGENHEQALSPGDYESHRGGPESSYISCPGHPAANYLKMQQQNDLHWKSMRLCNQCEDHTLIFALKITSSRSTFLRMLRTSVASAEIASSSWYSAMQACCMSCDSVMAAAAFA